MSEATRVISEATGESKDVESKTGIESNARIGDQHIVFALKDIAKDYHQGRSVVEVLKTINLEVVAGQMVAIVGASGSGKSTLLHIAGLLDRADRGTVFIDGYQRDAADLEGVTKIRLKKIGFIYQYHHLLGDFTARENVAMPLIISGAKASEACDLADELLNKVGLGNRLYNLPGELSGGEMQRVAIARSLINNPAVILADEPTGNLDPHTADEIFELLLARAEEHGAAIVMVTHNMLLAAKMHKCYKLDSVLSLCGQD